jgi:hypothetical protein
MQELRPSAPGFTEGGNDLAGSRDRGCENFPHSCLASFRCRAFAIGYEAFNIKHADFPTEITLRGTWHQRDYPGASM